VANLKDALAGTNVESIKDATDKLMGVSQSFSQRLYEQASQAASAPGGSDGSGSGGSDDGAGSDDEVVDAEIVDEQ
jgi:molecular chaperone DnaK